MKRGAWVLGAILAVSATGAAARADTFMTYGDITVVGGNFQLTSSPSGAFGYAGFQDHITTSVLTPSTLTNLSAEYEMTLGAFGDTAPHFTLYDESYNAALIYWGTPAGGKSFADPYAGVPGLHGTGNLADLSSSDLRVFSYGFGGFDTTDPTGVTWKTFVNQVKNVPITYVALDLDGATYDAPPQTMLVSYFAVNDDVLSAVPLPASAWGGLALLGGLAIVRRRKPAVVPA